MLTFQRVVSLIEADWQRVRGSTGHVRAFTFSDGLDWNVPLSVQNWEPLRLVLPYTADAIVLATVYPRGATSVELLDRTASSELHRVCGQVGQEIQTSCNAAQAWRRARGVRQEVVLKRHDGCFGGKSESFAYAPKGFFRAAGWVPWRSMHRADAGELLLGVRIPEGR